jgi:tubulin---tyrosine ligase
LPNCRESPESIEKKPSDLVFGESKLVTRPKSGFYAVIAYEDAYVQPLIISALNALLPPDFFTMVPVLPDIVNDDVISLGKLLPDPNANVLQITPYEAIDWDFVAARPKTCLVNSYMLRKALIRKHYLASTVEHWVAKRPQSVLKDHVKRTEAFEVDYAEFLDDALVDAFDLRASLEKNEALLLSAEGEAKSPQDLEWWILKPGMSDRGQGIRLFCTMHQLQEIFDQWEAGRPDSEDEHEDQDEDESGYGRKIEGADEGDYITTSQLRHFVAQPYIDPPLLLPCDNRKFHIRTYVACVGGLDVYVYKPMLALFAGKTYTAPEYRGRASSASPSSPRGKESETDIPDIDLEAHLTNTCLQRSVADNTVQPYWSLNLPPLHNNEGKDDIKTHIFDQICAITGEVFEAAARSMQMHFRPLENAFELFGLDFLVDATGHVYLLEVNAFPDFRQTGEELKDLVAGLWRQVLDRAVGGFFGVPGQKQGADNEDLVHVRHVDLGF